MIESTPSPSEPTSEWPLLAEAHGILRAAVAGVPADGWQLSTPCSEWTVAQVLEHAALDQLLYVSAATGGEKPDGDAFHPTGELPEAVAFTNEALTRSAATFAGIATDTEGVGVPLPPFAVPARLAAGAAALDAAVHGWDIAVATGQPVGFSEALAAELLTTAQQLVEPLRGWGAYAPAIEPPADADTTSQLLLYLGRRPDWTR